MLQGAQGLIDRSLSALKAKTLDSGKLSNARLDDYQLVSYELSLCWAECCAARFMLDHSRACADAFTSRLCALFCADAVTASCARLRTRLADFELADADVAAVLNDHAAFLASQLSAANIAAIGEEVVDRGAGEILLTSWDRDGTKAGYELDLMRAASAAVPVPIIASGGASGPEHMVEALRAGADAVLAASIFHYGEYTVGELKDALAAAGLQVRR